MHEKGARFSVYAWGCNPGDVFSVWGIALLADADPIVVNCGGGIVLPNRQFKTICDVPMGNLTPCTACAQVIPAYAGASVGGNLGDPRQVDFLVVSLLFSAP
jgi:hypothetical protein